MDSLYASSHLSDLMDPLGCEPKLLNCHQMRLFVSIICLRLSPTPPHRDMLNGGTDVECDENGANKIQNPNFSLCCGTYQWIINSAAILAQRLYLLLKKKTQTAKTTTTKRTKAHVCQATLWETLSSNRWPWMLNWSQQKKIAV